MIGLEPPEIYDFGRQDASYFCSLIEKFQLDVKISYETCIDMMQVVWLSGNHPWEAGAKRQYRYRHKERIDHHTWPGRGGEAMEALPE